MTLPATSQGIRIDVGPIGMKDRRVVEDLIANHVHSTLTQYRGVTHETTAKFVASHLVGVSTPDLPTIVLGARLGTLVGIASLERRPWESAIYRRHVAVVPTLVVKDVAAGPDLVHDALIARLLMQARQVDFNVVIRRVVAEDVVAIHALERAGFRLMDTTVEYTWDVQRLRVEDRPSAWVVASLGRATIRIPKFGVVFRQPLASDVGTLKELAAEAFTKRMPMHYGANRELPAEGTARLYAEWVAKACVGEFADIVAVAVDDSGPIGVLTFKRNRELSALAGLQLGDMGLAVVAERATGKGVLPGLLLAVLHRCREEGLDVVRGRVHVANYAMQRGCFVCGGSITAAMHTYHHNLHGGRPPPRHN